ncbi:DUF294 nucleotidyltransferase-like domain-containing protein [Paludibacterium paludis]|uniref:Cyclic nucleotide-binding protein n=1 Tax=Paludibacterium paludis TaxID=1225769 RepID=A0A918NY38_9NEIS|nr:DUF294 nucleotidyltransferase-like domain-containing protein [Paludibacterium paludis]GGY06243.1 cyclic nucleotide-binding protein [Paludibacterium paludis]
MTQVADSDIHPAWRRLLAPHEPFASMPEEALGALLVRLRERRVRAGECILSPDSGIPDTVWIVLEGVVQAEDALRHQRFATLTGGEMFPLGAALAERAASNRYVAECDTRLAGLTVEAFREVMTSVPAFSDFCTRRLASLLTRSRELSRPGAALQAALQSPLRQLLDGPPPCLAPHDSLADALKLFRRDRIGAVGIVDAKRNPVGLVCQEQLPELMLTSTPLTTPLSRVMRTDITLLPDRTLASEAVLHFAGGRARHLMVCDDAVLTGIVTEQDLYRLTRLDFHELLARLAASRDEEELIGIARDIRQLALVLLRQGMEADAVTRLVATLTDRLTGRLCELGFAGAEELGIRICWLAFGSEGRLEQTFASDQDNGLIIAVDEPAKLTEHRGWAMSRAREINAMLSRCGIPLCPQGTMAGADNHCLTVEEWQRAFGDWIHHPSPETIDTANGYFDLRAVWGDGLLADQLRERIQGDFHRTTRCIRGMADLVLRRRPPLGWMGRIQPSRGLLDLKDDVARFFVDGARILALSASCPATRTLDRLAQASRILDLPERDAEAWADSFRFIQEMRLRHQIGQLENDRTPDNLIDPDALTALEHRILREALRQARKLQTHLSQTLLD